MAKESSVDWYFWTMVGSGWLNFLNLIILYLILLPCVSNYQQQIDYSLYRLFLLLGKVDNSMAKHNHNFEKKTTQREERKIKREMRFKFLFFRRIKHIHAATYTVIFN